MKPVQLYARCSTTNDQRTDSQKFALEKWAQKEEVEAEYREDIGTGAKMSRKELDKIRRGILDGDIKKLVVWKLSRLGRNVKGVLEFLEFCGKHDCEVYSLSEKIDVGTAMGKAMTTLIAVFDALVRDTISENTKAGLEASKTPPELRTGARIKGGIWFTNDKLKKRDAIFALAREGKSVSHIRDVCSIDAKTVRKMLALPQDLVVSKKECERIFRMVREGRMADPFKPYKTVKNVEIKAEGQSEAS